MNTVVEKYLECYFETTDVQKYFKSADYSTLQILHNEPSWFREFVRRKDEYQSWDWIYGKSPPFGIKKVFDIHEIAIEVEFKFENGCISQIKMSTTNQNFAESIMQCQDGLNNCLKDVPLRMEELIDVFSESQLEAKSAFNELVYDRIYNFLLSFST